MLLTGNVWTDLVPLPFQSRATVCAVAATHGCANVLVAYANGVFARYEEVKSQAEIVEDDEADMGGDE